MQDLFLIQFILVEEIKVNSIDSVGWEILGVDTDKSTSINYMVIKEKATDLHALVDFGSDWNYEVGVEPYELFESSKPDAIMAKAESIGGAIFGVKI